MFIFPSPPFQTAQELQTTFKQLDAAAPGYHIDIMDGNFVPNKMGSIGLTNQARKLTKKQLWVHLMVTNPLKYLEQLNLQPGDIISVHHEVLSDNHKTFATAARAKNLSPCLAVSPKTPLLKLEPFLAYFDSILVMSVEPGKAGQVFSPATFERIEELQMLLKKHNLSCKILIDGGLTAELIPELRHLGIWAAAATSAIFKENDYVNAFESLQESCQK